ncbi:thiamine ABC transporter substrate binding subunit [Erwinia sp. OLTSP20]|uniref:thiamine ABC transporter substrate binding subunit n=1 Tax=unclassified Erwinia TaxID=2622719 RepID=UPI000C590788|nr:thiamine ABC transporter substrate binding subunit [Erwinia sp. OAMSP11]PIJ70832.1 thiamine ABC transporter substrate binding subunit [Erwinia sp. OLSSP12]PIJ80198.1 thiamine ABC transporter substrate binding subunit [Erwinia sp. OLCASP19]PIJ82321.1 thiamine ABC transporter substrate binding subunit [Erwinia sp. OLMTSP26]PIJ85008.1 thiamine ABC transporter substrate binding subunit [Erwinia sp. OLMDSP33]PIJ92322.1 thiamine ABC transporter substrate binding subunit [Erwinia sp. OLTSP20]PIJ9
MLKYILSAAILLSAPAFAAKPVLTVYTYSAFSADWGPGPAVKKAFEKQCDCQLKYVTLEDGVSLLNRLRMEGKNSHADVVIGLDNNLLAAASNSGLFAPAGVNTTNLQVPGGWHDNTFIPFDYGYFAFVYDKNRLPSPPKSLKELVEGSAPIKVVYEDPRTSTPGLGLLLWMQKVFGDKTPQAWQQLAKKTVTVTKGWSEAYGLFLKGEADMVLSYTTSPAYHMIEEKKVNYVAASFSEGHYLQVEVAAQLKSSKQPALAQRFMQFVLSPDFQQTIPTGNWMYPVVPVALPADFTRLIKPDVALQYSSQQIANQRSAWVSAWQRAVSH